MKDDALHIQLLSWSWNVLHQWKLIIMPSNSLLHPHLILVILLLQRAPWASLSVYLYTPTTTSVVKLREIKTLLFQPAPWPLTAENVSGKTQQPGILIFHNIYFVAVQGIYLLSYRSKELSSWKQGVSCLQHCLKHCWKLNLPKMSNW